MADGGTDAWWRPGRDKLAGVITALIGLLVSLGGVGLVPARQLGDPVPLLLTAQSLLRARLIYLDWRAPILHLIFVVSLSSLAVAMVALLYGARSWFKGEARRAARIAVLINVGVVALHEVDAFIVAVWYVIAGSITVLAAGAIAGLVARMWQRWAGRRPYSKVAEKQM